MVLNQGETSDSPNISVIVIIFLIDNSILCLMGLGLIIVGSLALSDVSNINTENIKPLLDLFTMDSAVGTVNTLSITLIVIGVFIFVVVGLSFAGARFEKKYIFVQVLTSEPTAAVALQYGNLVLVLLVMKIVVIALWFTMKSKVETDMLSKMVAGLKSQFLDDTTSNSNSLSNAWNYLHMTLDCCGVNAVASTTNDFDQTYWCTTAGSCQATSSQIPKTCCLNVDENTYTSAPAGCHASVNSGTYNAKGCYAALQEKLLCYSDSIIGLVITTIVLEIPAVILAFLIRKRDIEQCLDLCCNRCRSSSVGAASERNEPAKEQKAQ